MGGGAAGPYGHPASPPPSDRRGAQGSWEALSGSSVWRGRAARTSGLTHLRERPAQLPLGLPGVPADAGGWARLQGGTEGGCGLPRSHAEL